MQRLALTGQRASVKKFTLADVPLHPSYGTDLRALVMFVPGSVNQAGFQSAQVRDSLPPKTRNTYGVILTASTWAPFQRLSN